MPDTPPPCETCDGHGFVPPASPTGSDHDPCPDCAPPAIGIETATGTMSLVRDARIALGHDHGPEDISGPATPVADGGPLYDAFWGLHASRVRTALQAEAARFVEATIGAPTYEHEAAEANDLLDEWVTHAHDVARALDVNPLDPRLVAARTAATADRGRLLTVGEARRAVAHHLTRGPSHTITWQDEPPDYSARLARLAQGVDLPATARLAPTTAWSYDGLPAAGIILVPDEDQPPRLGWWRLADVEHVATHPDLWRITPASPVGILVPPDVDMHEAADQAQEAFRRAAERRVTEASSHNHPFGLDVTVPSGPRRGGIEFIDCHLTDQVHYGGPRVQSAEVRFELSDVDPRLVEVLTGEPVATPADELFDPPRFPRLLRRYMAWWQRRRAPRLAARARRLRRP